MRKYHIPQPQKIRTIKGSFAWVDHRLLRNGYLDATTHQDLALYLFLVLAADRNGVIVTMKPSKQYLRFCGIDVAKKKHVACIIDQDGRYLVRPKSIRNDAAGYQQILNCLKQSGRKKAILPGMEATGHDWHGLHDFLIRHGYSVAVLNPIQTAQQVKQAIRKCKTDKYDAPRRHVRKRGSPYLRRTLWQMAYRSVCTEGDLRGFWRRKHRQEKHHLVVVTAAANKLCHIVWRIMTDHRDYIPKGHNPKS